MMRKTPLIFLGAIAGAGLTLLVTQPRTVSSQSYVPTDEKDDRALKEAFDLLRGTITDAAFPPDPKAADPK